MTRQEIDEVFERVKMWPLDRLEDAARTLLIMDEAGRRASDLSAEDQRSLDQGEASGIASDDDVRAAFARFPRSAA